LTERAVSVLAPQTRFDLISRDALYLALGNLRDDRRRMLELRDEIEDITAGRPWCDLDLGGPDPSAAQPAT